MYLFLTIFNITILPFNINFYPKKPDHFKTYMWCYKLSIGTQCNLWIYLN